MVQAALGEMKFQLPAPEVRYQWVPTEADLEPVRALARSVAATLPREPAPADFGL
jgi:flavorubredoxin